MGSADQGVVWSAVQKFSGGCIRFDPSFSKTEKGQGCVYQSDQIVQRNEEDGE